MACLPPCHDGRSLKRSNGTRMQAADVDRPCGRYSPRPGIACESHAKALMTLANSV